MPNTSFEKNSIGAWESKGLHNFPKSICLKVNLISRLEFELAYYDSTDQRLNHYATRTLHLKYFYLIQIICTELYGFKFSYLIQIICPRLYDIKYSYRYK